jgi:integrase
MWVERNGDKYRVRDWVDGKKKTIRTFETEADALMFVGAERSPVKGYSVLPMPTVGKALRRTTPTVADYGADLVADAGLSQASRDAYDKALVKIEESALGAMQLHTVTASDCRAFVNAVAGNRRVTIQFAHKLFNAAAFEGIIAGSPMKAARIKRPSVPQRRVQPLSVEQVEQLVANVGNDREKLAMRIAAYCGLRGGEVGALRPQDVDVEACQLHVEGSTKVTSGGRSVGSTKTRASFRTIAIACSLAEEVAEYLRQHPPAKDGPAAGRIFRSEQGGLVTSYQLSAWTRRAAKRAGIGHLSGHDLRHVCASILIAAGHPLTMVQRYLGHASIRETSDTYGHLVPNADQVIATGMEEALQAARTKAYAAAEGSAP